MNMGPQEAAAATDLQRAAPNDQAGLLLHHEQLATLNSSFYLTINLWLPIDGIVPTFHAIHYTTYSFVVLGWPFSESNS